MEETEPLLPKDQSRELSGTGKWEYFIFMTIGMGASWGLLNALYLEVPWFESTQPETIRLGGWMGIAGTLASGISLVISWSGVMNKFSGRNAALLLILVNIGLFFLMAFTWWIIIGGLSALLLFGTVGAAMIGNLGFLILLPWVSANFPPTSTNALLSGSSLASLICVVIQLVQSPGTSNSLFSPTIYFVILTLPSFLSIRCIFLVQRAAEAKEGSRNVERTCMSICPSWYRQKVFKHTFISVWTSMLSWWTVLIILPYASAVTDPE